MLTRPVNTRTLMLLQGHNRMQQSLRRADGTQRLRHFADGANSDVAETQHAKHLLHFSRAYVIATIPSPLMFSVVGEGRGHPSVFVLK